MDDALFKQLQDREFLISVSLDGLGENPPREEVYSAVREWEEHLHQCGVTVSEYEEEVYRRFLKVKHDRMQRKTKGE